MSDKIGEGRNNLGESLVLILGNSFDNVVKFIFKCYIYLTSE